MGSCGIEPRAFCPRSSANFRYRLTLCDGFPLAHEEFTHVAVHRFEPIIMCDLQRAIPIPHIAHTAHDAIRRCMDECPLLLRNIDRKMIKAKTLLIRFLHESGTDSFAWIYRPEEREFSGLNANVLLLDRRMWIVSKLVIFLTNHRFEPLAISTDGGKYRARLSQITIHCRKMVESLCKCLTVTLECSHSATNGILRFHRHFRKCTLNRRSLAFVLRFLCTKTCKMRLQYFFFLTQKCKVFVCFDHEAPR